MQNPLSDPVNRLFDKLLSDHLLETDAALARHIGMSPAVISRLRHGVYSLSAAQIIRIHEATGLSIREIKEILAERRVPTPQSPAPR